jgi:hypothetical protein
LLVQAEQGLGDTLQFIRYVPMLEAGGGEVITEVQPQLVPLLARSGFRSLVPQGAPLGKFDVQVELLSLPGLLATRLDTIPSDVPYLSAEPALVAHWRKELAVLDGLEPGKLRIGLQWQGREDSTMPWRSFPLVEIEPLARVPGVRLVSLQKGAGAEQIRGAAGRFELFDLGPRLDVRAGAFMDTAAVVKNLDLVITCDTALAHLAGGLAAPVWVVLPVAADWRWLEHREDSPWYPTMRLFRQREAGGWREVMERVAAAVRGMVGRAGV